jgi:hypothetical protein
LLTQREKRERRFKKLSLGGRGFNFILMKREEGERKKGRSSKRYIEKEYEVRKDRDIN